MKRRNFLKSLGLAAAAASVMPLVPMAAVPAAVHRGPIYPFRFIKNTRTVRVNREYLDARWEIGFLFQHPHYGRAWKKSSIPFRFHTREDAEYFLTHHNHVKQVQVDLEVCRADC